jgi:hypothetical protein
MERRLPEVKTLGKPMVRMAKSASNLAVQEHPISENLVAAALAWAAESTQARAEVSLENQVLSDPTIANWVTGKDDL